MFMQGAIFCAPGVSETISQKPRLMFHKNLCANVGFVKLSAQEVFTLLRMVKYCVLIKCDFCGMCEKTCTTKALKLSGDT